MRWVISYCVLFTSWKNIQILKKKEWFLVPQNHHCHQYAPECIHSHLDLTHATGQSIFSKLMRYLTQIIISEVSHWHKYECSAYGKMRKTGRCSFGISFAKPLTTVVPYQCCCPRGTSYQQISSYCFSANNRVKICQESDNLNSRNTLFVTLLRLVHCKWFVADIQFNKAREKCIKKWKRHEKKKKADYCKIQRSRATLHQPHNFTCGLKCFYLMNRKINTHKSYLIQELRKHPIIMWLMITIFCFVKAVKLRAEDAVWEIHFSKILYLHVVRCR